MKLAIFGAGNMGQGIAQCFALAGHHVQLHDQSVAQAESAVERIHASVKRRVEAGKQPARDLRLQAGGDVAEAELVIEAVFEDLAVKQALFSDLAKRTKAVLATNTSSFQVADLAVHDRVVGLHFFFPAHVNRLVELVPGTANEAAVSLARNAVESVGKTVIVTKDSPGFAINRFLVPVLNEAARLVDAGHALGDVEASGKAAFGMPLGPFSLMNASGTRVCAHAHETLHQRAGCAPVAESLARLAPDNTPWDVAVGEISDALVSHLQDCLRVQLAWIEKENVASVDDLDLGARVGLGWSVAPSTV
ncbi:MAG: 3-hydroxyacyl-CoA dehydrogenase family protein [Thermoplasmatota archaeon]